MLINIIGIGMCGPTVMWHGSQDQKDRYLTRLLRGDDIWCQLFSEPASGSDLAGLRTRAVQDEDGSWRITGQKVWTTMAHIAEYGIVLTRTDPDQAKHRGLTMFVVDMKAPGRHGPPAAPDERRRGVQRGLLRRRPACRTASASATSTTAGGSPSPR